MSQTHPNYELFEEIGRTKTTVVYRAFDLTLGRDVAIKELTTAGKSDPQRQERFLREAQYLAQTEHPGMLRIHTVVAEKGWIVMERMKGNLAAQIQHAAIESTTVRSILRQLLSALEFLHGRGKLHGSIRPSNILIDDAGSVRLSDFEQIDLDGELRMPTSSKKYLAPEWIRSEFGDLGKASDLYCLGFTALELLAGPNFDSLVLDSQAASVDSDVAWLRKHSSEEAFPSTASLIPGVPSDLATTIDELLKKQVSDRPASASEVLEKLDDQAVIAIEPVPAVAAAPVPMSVDMMPAAVREINPRQQASTPAAGHVLHRNPPVNTRDKINRAIEKPYVLYPLCALILLAALGVGLALKSKRSDDVTKLAQFEPTEIVTPTPVEPEPTEPEPVKPEPAKPEPTKPEPAKPEPAKPEPIEPEPIEPEPKMIAVDKPSSSMTEPGETSVPSAEVDPEANPLGGLLELVSKEAEVDTSELLAEFKGNPELVLDAGGFLSEVTDVAVDPRGRYIAASGGKVARIWSLETGRLLHTLRGDRSRTSYGNCNTLVFSPDGDFLLVGVSDYQPHGAIRVYKTDAFDEIDSLLAGHTSPIRQLAFSRDGKTMASADADGNIAVWDWPNRKRLKIIPPRSTQAPIIDELHFGGDEPVLFGVDVSGPFLRDADTLRQLSAADKLPPRLLGWMMNLLGQKLSYPFETVDDPRVIDLKLEQNKWAAAGIGKEGGKNQFWIGIWAGQDPQADPETKPRVVYRGHRWRINAIEIAPKQGIAVSGDKFGEVHVWDIETGKRLHRLRAQGKSVYEAALDRDSNRIAFGTRPFGADVWGRNRYGAIEKVLDLRSRSIYEIDPENELNSIQETAENDRDKIVIERLAGDAGLAVSRQRDGKSVARYELMSGRIPSVYSLIEQPTLGSDNPVLVGDNTGLLAVWDSQTDRLSRAFIGHESMVTSISVAENSKMLLSGSSDRTIRLWSLENRQPTGTFDFQFENAAVTKVEPGTSSAKAGVRVGDQIVAIDGMSIKEMYERMLTGEFDYRPGQKVPVAMKHGDEDYEFEMTMADGYDFSEPILSVFIGDEDRWIVWTPEGYYDAAPGAEKLIGWHVNRGPAKSARYFSVGQFREPLYRPDIIDRVLDGEDLESAVEAANRERDESATYDFRSPSDLASHHPPTVRFLSPSDGSRLDDATVNINAVVESPNGLPIREVTLLVNGIACQTFAPDSPVSTRMTIEHEIELDAATNEIELVARNAQSRGFAGLTLELPEARSDASPKTHLRVLSIGTAGGTTSEESNAMEDAEQFAETISSQRDGRLYEAISLKVLTGEDATREAILDGFEWLIEQTEPSDTVAIYLSADAFVDASDNFYIGAHDVDFDRPRATALSWREFVHTLRNDLPSCKRLVFLDLRPNDQAIQPGLRNPLLDLAAPELGTIFFSSTALQQRLPSDDDGRPRFLTTALASILKDQSVDVLPTPPDGLLTGEEASSGWMQRVRKISDGKLYPVAFSPAASREVNVLQLNKP